MGTCQYPSDFLLEECGIPRAFLLQWNDMAVKRHDWTNCINWDRFASLRRLL